MMILLPGLLCYEPQSFLLVLSFLEMQSLDINTNRQPKSGNYNVDAFYCAIKGILQNKYHRVWVDKIVICLIQDILQKNIAYFCQPRITCFSLIHTFAVKRTNNTKFP